MSTNTGTFQCAAMKVDQEWSSSSSDDAPPDRTYLRWSTLAPLVLGLLRLPASTTTAMPRDDHRSPRLPHKRFTTSESGFRRGMRVLAREPRPQREVTTATPPGRRVSLIVAHDRMCFP
jgi:hypothetical protein